MQKEEITMQEILEAINESSTKMQAQFSEIQSELQDLRKYMDKRFAYHETWLSRIESNMATKNQLSTLCSILEDKNILSSFEKIRVRNS